MQIEDKEYDFSEMSIEAITDICAQLNAKKSKCESLLEKAKPVVKARFTAGEIAAFTEGLVGELKIQEADDFHPLDPKACFEAMKKAGHESDFPLICSVNLNDSGKKAKVKTLGITHFLPAIVVDKLRIKKRAKALTVYFTMKKD